MMVAMAAQNTIHLTDERYAELMRVAQEQGTTPDELADKAVAAMLRRARRDARAERVSMPRCGRENVMSRMSVRTRVSPCKQPAVQLHAGQHTIAVIGRALRCNKKQL